MTDPKWLAKAEQMAGPHAGGCTLSRVYVVFGKRCNCRRAQRVEANALALEEAHAEGKAEGRAESVSADFLDSLHEANEAYARGRAEGRKERAGPDVPRGSGDAA